MHLSSIVKKSDDHDDDIADDTDTDDDDDDIAGDYDQNFTGFATKLFFVVFKIDFEKDDQLELLVVAIDVEVEAEVEAKDRLTITKHF